MMIIIGNILSFIAALFLLSSCLLKRKDKIFVFQFLECTTLAAASFFFNSYAGISTLLLNAVRNIIIAKNRFTKPLMYVFLALTVATGLISNNRGFLGLMPIIATVQITVCGCVINGVAETKLSIAVNTAIWVVYSFFVHDYSTAVIDSVIMIFAFCSGIKTLKTHTTPKT